MTETLPSFQIIAPGRVNLIGEHIDYNDGPVLPVAIDLSLSLKITPLEEDHIELHPLDLGTTVVFRIKDIAKKVDIDGNPLPHFALYPASVAWAAQLAGYPLWGMRAEYSSNIPIGSGLSSSAAVEVGFAQGLKTLGGWEADRMMLVKLAQKGENEYVGVSSGIMDQFACLFGKENHALYLDTRSLQWEAIPLANDVAIIVADSRASRQLAGSAYNDRRLACRQAVEGLRQVLPGLESLRDVNPETFNRHAGILPESIRQRARHVVEEIARVEKSVNLLKQGDISGFGSVMVDGHRSLRDLYEVSTPELDVLVAIALKQEGCFGARLTGAGFGGCTVNLVREKNAEDFIAAVTGEYLEKTGKHAKLYHCHAARGAHVV